MRKTSVLGQAATSVIVGAVVMICAGCPHNNHGSGGKGFAGRYPHNLAHLHCGDQHIGENYQIEVIASPQVLKDLDNKIVFACGNDSLSWFIADTNFVLRVNFTDSYAGDLFEGGRSTFESKHGDRRNETDKPKVKPPTGHEWQIFKYSIEVDDGNGHDYRIDPHVIPTGK